MAGKTKLVDDALEYLLRTLAPEEAVRVSRTGVNPAHFKPYTSNWRGTETSYYNPEYWRAVPDTMEDEAGKVIATREKLDPVVPHLWAEQVIKQDPELMYRGMSADELADILLNRQIKSRGDYNFDNQKGLTYFTSDPASAESYANGFAPADHKPNMERPAYIVAAKRPSGDAITNVGGVATHEIGVNRPTPLNDVVGVYRGKTTAFDPGVQDKGLYVAPTARLHWEQKSLDDVLKGRAQGGSVREGYQTKGRVVGDVVEQALKLVMGAGPELTANGIRAYHGSPHYIDRFDVSKIGTGEGAQAYGHGLYFAGKEDIAKWYRDKLSRHTYYDGTRISDLHPSDSPMAAAIHSVAPYIADGEDAQKAIAQQWAKWNASAEKFEEVSKTDPARAAKALEKAQSFRDVANELQALDPTKFLKNPGHMYEVEIAADPNRLIDWNDPLKEQPADVRSAIMPFAEERAARINKARRELLDRGVDMMGRPFKPERLQKLQEVADPETFTGENIYRQIQAQLGANNHGDKAAEASQFLTDKGLHGIQYLDASSRGSGIIEPTKNFVIPEDKRVSILRRYAEGGEVAVPDDRDEYAGGGFISDDADRDIESAMMIARGW